jgi:hypothetical protein
MVSFPTLGNPLRRSTQDGENSSEAVSRVLEVRGIEKSIMLIILFGISVKAVGKHFEIWLRFGELERVMGELDNEVPQARNTLRQFL